MSNPTIKIVDAQTGKEIEREMTEEESSDYLAHQAALEAQIAQDEARAVARQSALEKLAALGLTEAEIQALAG